MAPEVIVEVLDGRGRVQTRARLSRFPASIGRAFSNDVIIDDPYVDAQHLRLVADDAEGVAIEDAGSVNGSFEPGSSTRVTRVRVRPGLGLRIGETQLRFQDPDSPPAPTLVLREELSFSRLGDARIAVPLALLVVLVFSVTGWLGAYERGTVMKHVSTGVFVLLIVAFWAALWSLGSRVIQHRFNFLAHLTLASLVLLAMEVVSTVATWLGVMLPNFHLNTVVGWLGGIPLVFALLAGHLALTSTLSGRRRNIVTAGIMASVVAIVTLAGWADRDKFSTKLVYDSVIRPVPLSMLRTSSPEGFFRETGELREKVDQLAAKANRKPVR
jgi:hypothetical protein